ncbi:Cys/Met metabolism PLP-dependent enzyme-domain-containing protein [Triangularia verruculosa]|uniref:Cys/Met metabolism PLP-dependent enzyme-domain-containing protein n=1 Tax=Triangularia verruculosa TaxID=2587418 RepID=A0AAN6XCT2_9PEZI|nr:Cys/Met metabolism PLP-dependent enzyme-domain-containing protein [Triangularia verruculosa]
MVSNELPVRPAGSAVKTVVEGPNSLTAAFGRELSMASRSVHADDYINNHQAVAPPMHVSTTFRYNRDPEQLRPWDNINPNAPYDSHVYSRDSAPNTTRFEALLTSLLGAPTLSYASGLAAFHAMIVFLNPKRVAIGGGYHGCHGILDIMKKLNGLEQLELEDDADLAKLEKGDVIHVETPLNPTGEARDLAYYRKIADEKGCYLTVDATFAPPPLMEPFKYNVDMVMHSATKYFGGHSDMLAGVLAIRPEKADKWLPELRQERLHLGGVMGSLEGWLGVRSVRTLELRVKRQSESAQNLVDFLAEKKAAGDNNIIAQSVFKIQHASQQPEAKDENSWLRKQMPNGFGPVFSMWLENEEKAKRLPSKLQLFHHATSLGGVESLIEWRAMTDPNVDRRLLRVSIGVEGWEDLRDDLVQGLEKLKEEGY